MWSARARQDCYTQFASPRSVNVVPAAGTNAQLYLPSSTNLATPNEPAPRASLLLLSETTRQLPTSKLW
jgi:hypothetical protein